MSAELLTDEELETARTVKDSLFRKLLRAYESLVQQVERLTEEKATLHKRVGCQRRELAAGEKAYREMYERYGKALRTERTARETAEKANESCWQQTELANASAATWHDKFLQAESERDTALARLEELEVSETISRGQVATLKLRLSGEIGVTRELRTKLAAAESALASARTWLVSYMSEPGAHRNDYRLCNVRGLLSLHQSPAPVAAPAFSSEELSDLTWSVQTPVAAPCAGCEEKSSLIDYWIGIAGGYEQAIDAAVPAIESAMSGAGNNPHWNGWETVRVALAALRAAREGKATT